MITWFNWLSNWRLFRGHLWSPEQWLVLDTLSIIKNNFVLFNSVYSILSVSRVISKMIQYTARNQQLLLNSYKFKVLHLAWLYASPVNSKNLFTLICARQGLNLDFWVRKPSCYNFSHPCLFQLAQGDKNQLTKRIR